MGLTIAWKSYGLPWLVSLSKTVFVFWGVAFENRKPNRQRGWVKEEDRMRTLKTRQKQTDIICFEININLRSIHFCFSKVWQCLRSKRSQQCTCRFPVNGSKSQLCTQLPTWHILTARLCLSRYLFLKISTHQKGHPAKKPNKKPPHAGSQWYLHFKIKNGFHMTWLPRSETSLAWIMNPIPQHNVGLTAGELNAADRVYSWCREHRWLLTEWIRKD